MSPDDCDGIGWCVDCTVQYLRDLGREGLDLEMVALHVCGCCRDPGCSLCLAGEPRSLSHYEGAGAEPGNQSSG